MYNSTFALGHQYGHMFGIAVGLTLAVATACHLDDGFEDVDWGQGQFCHQRYDLWPYMVPQSHNLHLQGRFFTVAAATASDQGNDHSRHLAER